MSIKPTFTEPKSRAARVMAGIVESWRKIRRKTRESGPLYTTQLVIQHLIPKNLFNVQMFFLCELDLRKFARVRGNDPEIRSATEKDVDLLANLGPSPSFWCASFERGARVWVLEREGQVIAFMRLIASDYSEDWLFPILFKGPPKDIWGTFLKVVPECRGQGIGPRMNRHVASECARLGYSRIMSCVDTLNRNALRADQKVGYRRIIHFIVIRFLGFTLVHSKGSLRLGRWSSRRRLELQVDLFDKKPC